MRDAHVVYDRNSILFVGKDSPPRATLNAGQNAPDCDLPDCTLLPGLTDAHTHLFLEGGELDEHRRAAYLQQTADKLIELARSRLEKLVRLGIAGVRETGDRHGVGLALSKLNASGVRPLMPYVDSPGAAIHHRGRYGSFMAEPIEDYASPGACVEARIHAGAERIKLIATGIINFEKGAVTAPPQMTAEEIGEFVAAAQARGKQTLAHASGDAGIEHAIEGRVDTIEHGFFVRDDQLAKMRDFEIAWLPTFAPVQRQVDHADRMGWNNTVVANLQHILDRHAASLVKAHEIGVRIIAGSDAGSYGVAHGLGLFYELELMQRAGLSPLAVVHCATGAGSERLRFREKFGEIKPGFLSRMIVTWHSPLKNIADLGKERIVLFDGEVFGTEDSAGFTGL